MPSKLRLIEEVIVNPEPPSREKNDMAKLGEIKPAPTPRPEGQAEAAQDLGFRSSTS